MVILDTNIIIDHLRTDGQWESLLEQLIGIQPEVDLSISVITIQELYAGKSTRNLINESNMLNLFSIFEILPYNYNVAKIAGQIIRDSIPIVTFADAAIAATAIYNGLELYTQNRKHFDKIVGLRLFNI